MKKFWIQIIALTLIIFGGLYFYSNPSVIYMFFPNNAPIVTTKLKVGNNILNIEIADNTEERAKGLSGREKLASDSGMLFVFSESQKYRFWMKDMKIPLDIIFINEGGVVDLLKNIVPPGANQKDSDLPILSPITPVDMVLEVSSGYIDSHGIKVGDSVTLVK
ncbi:MAG: DUF192 domain-containing protein [Candidatus Daviesbacteria bacterium]|nr:DUF192 domain-containing protein [Candidatus Daviesbacteria bacterium]